MKFHQLKIKSLQKITKDTIEVTFNIPEEITDDFGFHPGQYLTIAPTVNGEKTRRAYSICSDSIQDDVSILIKKIDKGLVSNYMNDLAEVNQRLLVAAPNGHFKLDPHNIPENAEYVFIGAGSGITPLISMIQSVLKLSTTARCHLYYGSRAEDDIIYHHKLNRLKLVYKERLQVHHFLSRAKSKMPEVGKHNVHFHMGRVDVDFVQQQVSNISTSSLEGIYLCGPSELIEASIARFEKGDVPADKIHREYFTAPDTEGDDLEFAVEDLPIRKVKVELDNKEIEIVINDEKDILRQLIADGYEPPYSCLQGTCSTCKAKLISGDVKMKVDIGLEADEIENGYILTCQSIPISETVHCIYKNQES